MGDSGPIISVDTREQRPYSFPQMEIKTLRTGDYSIVGLEDRIAIERKSKVDAYSSIGAGRARFQREIERLGELDYGALVIEASFLEFMVPPPFSRLSPRSAVNSILAWSIRHGMHVHFAGSREMGALLTRRLLEKYWRHHGAGRRR